MSEQAEDTSLFQIGKAYAEEGHVSSMAASIIATTGMALPVRCTTLSVVNSQSMHLHER